MSPDAVRRGYPPEDGYRGYPEEKMYPVCPRCTHRHGIKENCVGEVGKQDLEERIRLANEKGHAETVVWAIELLTQEGFEVLAPVLSN